jgi:Ferric reductase like transmembrane component
VVATVVTSSSALWYFARATGIVALLLLTTSVILGILTTVRWSSRLWPRFAVEYLHRNVTLLLLAFIVLHVATIVIDGFAPIGWISVLVPLSSPYRPVWLGLGALAFDLLLAVTITSWLRHRVGFAVWRALHWCAYAAWVLVVIHGLAAGTDTKQRWTLLIDAACVLAVMVAVWWRLAVGWEQRTRIRIAALVATFVIPAALVAFVLLGPLAPNWARRSGTPAALLARSHGSTTSSSQPSTGAPGRARSDDHDRDDDR